MIKIVSGGQAGVDRGALDGAIAASAPHGGWCPKGRLAEDGKIPRKYNLSEHESADFIDRTRQNVVASDGTLILYRTELSGGTAATLYFCREYKKPHLLVDAAETAIPRAVKSLESFVLEEDIGVLNVAGPRESGWAGGHDYALRLIRDFCAKIGKRQNPKNAPAPTPRGTD